MPELKFSLGWAAHVCSDLFSIYMVVEHLQVGDFLINLM